MLTIVTTVDMEDPDKEQTKFQYVLAHAISYRFNYLFKTYKNVFILYHKYKNDLFIFILYYFIFYIHFLLT